MANQITDNRTAVYAFDSTGSTDDLAGAASGNLDSPPEVFIQGGASIGEVISDSVNGILFDAGSAQDWSSNVFYIWINCGIVGLLDIKANAGFTIRFCGATVTDWFEVYVGGSDSWPQAVNGGWVQFVVDIEDARAAAVIGTVGGVNGTTPATTAIRYVGWSGITATVMTKMVDNTWIDEIRRLPDGSPGIIVEGRNGGSTDWNSDDIVAQLGIGIGTFKDGPGGSYIINTPIQFGISDSTTHGFDDTNAIWLWEDQEFAPTDLYSISALGNSGGTTNVTFGIKTGSGNSATGAQGLTIQAASGGVRWAIDFDDPDLDAIGLFGSTFIHGGTFELDDVAVDIASVTMIDCDKAHLSNANVVRLNVIAPNTADGVAFCDTDDIGDIANSSFEFSDGHGIEILSGGPSSQSNIGNIFNGAYGGTPGDNNTPSSGSNDAMIYNNAAAARTFNRSGGGTLPSFRNGASATSDDVAAISLTFTPLQTNTEVRLYETGTSTQIDGVENSGASFVASAGASQALDYKLVNPGFFEINVKNVSFATSQNVNITQRVDPNFITDVP